MKNIFPIVIIALFLGASVASAITKDMPRAAFYLLSALININILFLR